MTTRNDGELRRNRPRVLRAAVAVTAAALVAALSACDDGSTSSSSSSATTGATATTSAVATTAPAAVAAARPLSPASYVLVAGPATSGYIEDANTDSSESSVFEAPVPTCMHLSDSELGPPSTDHANGPTFSTHAGVNIQSGARVFASADTVAKHGILTQRKDFPGCIGQAIVKSLSNKDSENETVTITDVEAGTPPAGATALTQLAMEVASDGQTVKADVDLISIFGGRVESVILVIGPEGTVDGSLLASLTSQVAATLANQ